MNKKLRKNLGIFLISLSSATVLLGSGSEIEAAKRKDYSLNGDKNETGDENKDFEEQVKEFYENNIRTYVEQAHSIMEWPRSNSGSEICPIEVLLIQRER